MSYLKGLAGGAAAVLALGLVGIVWLTRRVPPGVATSFSLEILLVPRVLLMELAVFLLGFVVVWKLSRQ